ncbi:MAG: alpha/beta hydrolase [Acidimicrobiia bacterium]|nr:alpha/beta hydrolase [Acidimicrobiia bacterium]MDH5238258.1 alpha/beta hydrolase [Acidimicrobiia bacterium]
MPAVFVHGVPDTDRVWEPLIAELGRGDVVSLQLPGFGCDAPVGWRATKEEYADWLVTEVVAIDEPVDIVGHDWGGMLVARLLTLAPTSVRTWTFGGSPVDPAYVWHDMAKLWQTPEVGEELMTAFDPDTAGPGLVEAGVPQSHVDITTAAIDDRMKTCILALYRSAVTVGTDWGSELAPLAAPGLVLWGGHDPYAPADTGRAMATRCGARFEELDTGHWWQLEAPAVAAGLLEAHWAR